MEKILELARHTACEPFEERGGRCECEGRDGARGRAIGKTWSALDERWEEREGYDAEGVVSGTSANRSDGACESPPKVVSERFSTHCSIIAR